MVAKPKVGKPSPPPREGDLRQSLFVDASTKMALAVLTAFVGGAATFFADEIHAYISYLFVGGNLRGQYVLQTFYYDDDSKEWKPVNLNLTLKHGGTYVFGTQSSTTSDVNWK